MITINANGVGGDYTGGLAQGTSAANEGYEADVAKLVREFAEKLVDVYGVNAVHSLVVQGEADHGGANLRIGISVTNYSAGSEDKEVVEPVPAVPEEDSKGTVTKDDKGNQVATTKAAVQKMGSN